MKEKLTPLMQQYFDIKGQYPGLILLFQVGDFYELFFDDAKDAAAFLGIALTKRGTHKGEPIPLCGVPVHALDHYISKLVRGGYKVAVCDQLEEAVAGKVVRRGVTRVLTPGTLTDTKLLDEKSASYLVSFFTLGNRWALISAELLTAQLYAVIIEGSDYKTLDSELARFSPDEILLPSNKVGLQFQSYFKRAGYFTSLVMRGMNESANGFNDVTDTSEPNYGVVRSWMGRQFTREVAARVNGHAVLIGAMEQLHAYLSKNQQQAIGSFSTVHFYKADDFLVLDPATQKNLELVCKAHDGGRANTLFSHLDCAVTAMGSRMIKKWLLRPLINRDAIVQRQNSVAAFVKDPFFVQNVAHAIRGIGDLERVVGRVALSRATVHDYVLLKQALGAMPRIQRLLAEKRVQSFTFIASKLSLPLKTSHGPMYELLHDSINEEFSKNEIIKAGFNKKLDTLRELAHNSVTKILELEKREQAATGIQSLKVRYNNVHGYYIEVTKANLHLVPDSYIRKQTLVGRERFITEELRTLQGEIITARAEVKALETELFENVKQEIIVHVSTLRQMAYALAFGDALLGLAKVAYEYGYVRPQMTDNRDIVIKKGSHPVVRAKIESRFIPNDTVLNDQSSFLIITGPNMGGKSTYLRQVALICLMAQCGAFVPAEAAELPLLDRIFTRIGAGDNLAEGKSTFLVEMEETALICTQATERSLVILDEVGRGTSTFDGLAIAQAVVEYLFNNVRPRCLFATHYHELTALHDTFPGIDCYYASSRQTDAGIVFLYKMMRGVADGSFGIEVARLAHVPDAVIQRAQALVHTMKIGGPPIQKSSASDTTKDLECLVRSLRQDVKQKDLILAMLDDLDYDNLSPKKAFDLLWALKSKQNEL